MALSKKKFLFLWAPISVLTILVVLGYKIYKRLDMPSERKHSLRYFKAMTFSSKEYARGLPYRIFVPAGYDEKQHYPLILYLHGGGGRGNDNTQQLDVGPISLAKKSSVSDTPFIVLAPQCPSSRKWMDKYVAAPPYLNHNQDKYPESDIVKAIIKLIEHTSRTYSVDKRRLYISGFSMGATGVWDIITRHPDMFAAAVILSGENDPSKGYKLVDMPIWAFHGQLDGIAPVENTRKMIDSIRANQGKKIKYTEYPDSGHGINEQVYRNEPIVEWLLTHKLP